MRAHGRRARSWRPPLWLWLPVGLLLLAYLVALAWTIAGMRGHNLPGADAVLVLGARAYLNGAPNPCLVARVRRGVELAGTDRVLVVSGGTDREDGRSEAQVMGTLARQLGFPAGRLVLEPRATSTAENLRFAHALLQARGRSRVLIVSEGFHLARVGWLARREDLTFGTAAASWTPCGLRGTLREPLALLKNWLAGG